jgi:hypothetical protein
VRLHAHDASVDLRGEVPRLVCMARHCYVYIRRNNEEAYWSPLSRQLDLFRLSQAVTLTDIHGDRYAPVHVEELDKWAWLLGRVEDWLLHANDSRDPCGSSRDRHQTIGAGQIGEDGFAELLAHPATASVPVTRSIAAHQP